VRGTVAAQDRFEIAAHAASLGVWEWDLVADIFTYSARAREICGFDPIQPLTYPDIAGVTHPDDLPWTSAMAKRALDPELRENKPYRYRIVRADNGQVRWVLAHGEPVFDRGVPPKALRYIGTLQDITEQQQSEHELAESEARLRLAVEAGRMAVWELDLDRDVLTPSPALNMLFGFPDDAHPTLEEIRQRYAPGENERLELEGNELTARGETEIQTTLRQIWPDQSQHWFLLRARLAPPTEAISKRVLGVVIDITLQKAAEERAELIAREMQHRVKNVLTVAQSLARHSLKGSAEEKAAAESFAGRLQALSAATRAVTAADYESHDLASLVEEVIAPFRRSDGSGFVIDGLNLSLPQTKATGLALCLHELCTNAIKYGALCVPTGVVALSWHIDGKALEIIWTEREGPRVTPPSSMGFGASLLTRGALGPGKVDLSFPPSGATCKITLDLG
jgi:PAS domain S-box-containing protein